MYLNCIDVKELDYFDMLRLNGKEAVFDVSPGNISISCEGIRYKMDPDVMKCSDLNISKDPAEALKDFKNNEVPLDSVSLHEKGILILHNMEDRLWLFAFASKSKHLCLLRTGNFEQTIGEI